MRMASGFSRRGVVGAMAASTIFSRPAAATPILSPHPVGAATAGLRPFRIIADHPSFERLISPTAKLEVVATFPRLRGEGPIWRKGKLLFTELREGQIIEVALDGTWRVFAERAGGPIDPAIPTLQGPNGIASWRNGALLVCRQGSRDIGILRRDGTMSAFIRDYQGRRFNSPNDIVVHPDGSIWFTDPPLALPGHPWARPADPDAPPKMPPVLDKQIPFNGVFRYKDGAARAVITDMEAPNGLAFSPDGRTLYVNNAIPGMFARSFAVGRAGKLSGGREIFRLPADTPQGIGVPDGLKIDVEGNLWMSGPGGLYVIAPDGTLLGRIQLPSRSTNLTFGDDYRSLFIVSNPQILRIRTRVRGVIPPCSKA